MTNGSLAQSYLRKATDRLDVLTLLQSKDAYSDVVREAQEIVELALKGMLRQVGVEPPHWHDVGSLIVQHRDRFPESVRQQVEALAEISKRLREDRELSFYGDVDFIPTEEYGPDEAHRAITDAQFAAKMAQRVIEPEEE